MQHPFAALAGEYASLLARMEITRPASVRMVAERLVETDYHFDDACAATGVRKVWAAASFEREASSNFRLSPAQGDPWDRISIHVPRGRGPYPDFKSAAIEAYEIDGLQKVGFANWTWARACYEGELFNGFGYRAHGVHSPYLWAGTNIYDKGKYTSDGEFAYGVRDQQLGIVPLMAAMIELSPALALVDTLPIFDQAASLQVSAPQPAPVGLGSTVDDTKTLQAALNKLAHAELTVDGSYGRATRRAVMAFQARHGLEPDGLAGPLTVAAIEQALAP